VEKCLAHRAVIEVCGKTADSIFIDHAGVKARPRIAVGARIAFEQVGHRTYRAKVENQVFRSLHKE